LDEEQAALALTIGEDLDALENLEETEATSDAFFSAFAPREIFPDAGTFVVEVTAFTLEHSAEVQGSAVARGKAEAGKKGPLSIHTGAQIKITLELPGDAFDTTGLADTFVWTGTHGTAQFEVTCLRGAELRSHTGKAAIDIGGSHAAVLLLELNVVARHLPSPPTSPPGEMAETGELRLPEFKLSAGKQYHFFICHHQGSGGDQSNLLCLELRALGYSVWYDNGVMATQRNLPGMKDGVTKSECMLIFLSGRKEVMQAGEGVADPNGDYEGPFTRWFCHEEIGTAREHELRFIGVMETELRHGKPDLALEKSRARTGHRHWAQGRHPGGPVHDEVEENLRLMDDICFIPFRRQEHEVRPMLAEIIRQAKPPAIRVDAPQS
jgi:hypothetical protein